MVVFTRFYVFPSFIQKNFSVFVAKVVSAGGPSSWPWTCRPPILRPRLGSRGMSGSVATSPGTSVWMEHSTVRGLGCFNFCFCRVDKCVESPVKEGYRNKCEFAIGLNPETRRLTVSLTYC